MIKTIALAGAAAALVIGTIAVADTAPGASNPNMSNNNSGPSATQTTTGAASSTSAPASSANAPAAGQYGSDTAANTETAGERG